MRLGYVALREGNLEEARRIFLESTQEFKKDRITIGVVFTLEGWAALDLETGIPLRAARLIGWADSTRKKISDQRPFLEQSEVDAIMTACRAKIGEAEFLEVYEEGKKMSLEEAVAYALSQDGLVLSVSRPDREPDRAKR